MDQWDEHMADFEPSDMLTIQIPSRGQETFYENIQTTPSRVRGAWYIASGDKKKIDFWIVDPNGQISSKTENKNEGIFYFDAVIPGVYEFVFSNTRSWEMKDVTFAIHFGEHTDEHASAEDLDPLQKSLNKALRNLKNLYSEVKFSVGRWDSHNTRVEDTMKSNVWIVLIETIVIVCLAAAQIYFIKKILDNKRVM